MRCIHLGHQLRDPLRLFVSPRSRPLDYLTIESLQLISIIGKILSSASAHRTSLFWMHLIRVNLGYSWRNWIMYCRYGELVFLNYYLYLEHPNFHH